MSTDDHPPLLEIDDLHFSYPGGATVLSGARLTVHRGDFVLVQGSSGAGKSTLLRLLCRLEEPTSGRILLQGRDTAELSPPLLRRNLCYIHQSPALAPGSVRDNLLLPFTFAANADLSRPTEADLRGRLDHFRLDMELDREAHKLSGGQKQRLCLVRALLLNPKVLLLDEPSSALDEDNADIVNAMAETLNREGTTILMTSHSGYAPGVAHRVLDVRGGKAVFA